VNKELINDELNRRTLIIDEFVRKTSRDTSIRPLVVVLNLLRLAVVKFQQVIFCVVCLLVVSAFAFFGYLISYLARSF
jgi:hypothetical protein